jgi:DNA-binding response OmpR family regulator
MSYALSREGFRVSTAADGPEALVRWEADRPDLVLLDGNLPGLDGFEVCERIRHDSRTPVIMLTARGQEADVVRGLQVGADDYITKPFSPKQLTARMQAVLRRYRSSARQPASEVHVGNLMLDVGSHAVRIGPGEGKQVSLTRTEFRLLHLLALNEGRVVPYPRLIEYACGYYDEGSTTLLRTHVSHLRTKLRLPTSGPGSIQSVVGVGYTLARNPRGVPAQPATS